VLSGAPYGYRYVRKSENSEAHYVILETEAEVVCDLFRSYTQEGLSINALVRWLNRQGIPTRTGGARLSRRYCKGCSSASAVARPFTAPQPGPPSAS
jgi:site-specific DNA recombinase